MIKPALNFGDFKKMGIHPYTPEMIKKLDFFMTIKKTQAELVKFLLVFLILGFILFCYCMRATFF